MTDKLLEMTSEIVGGFVTGNPVATNDLPALIRSVRAALEATQKPLEPEVAPVTRATAAQIRKSITHDHLISFEDGKPYKTLKRHLSGRGLTIPAYKEKWGLPKDYPVAAPSYSAKRSAMAKSLGLGRKAPVASPTTKGQRKA